MGTECPVKRDTRFSYAAMLFVYLALYMAVMMWVALVDLKV